MASHHNLYRGHDSTPDAAYIADLERAAPSDAIAKCEATIDAIDALDARLSKVESFAAENARYLRHD